MFRTENYFSRRHSITIANQILISIVLAIFCGLFFGDLCRFLMPIGNIYTMLLEVAIYPYIVATLLSNLGRMSLRGALQLFKKGGVIYLCLIVLTIVTILALARAFPIITSSIRPSTSTVAGSSDLLNLLIPDNLFEALSNNYVPAVVLFCILFGVMLQRVKGEHVLFKILDTLSKACIEFWDWLIKFAPIGVFATVAYAAGTLHFSVIRDSLEYLILFFFGAFLLAFWLLPCVISSLTDLRYRDIMRILRDVLIITVSTTMSILLLPYLYKITTELLKERKKKLAQGKEIIETTNLISYPFGQLGNCFVYLFILFASTYYNEPISKINSWLLPFTSYLGSLGSPDSAVSAVTFLASWLQMPSDILRLYTQLSLITIYPQVLVSAMSIVFLVILTSFSYYGLLKLHWKKLFTHLVLVGVLLLIFIYCSKTFIPNPGVKVYQRLLSATINPTITQGVTATLVANSKPANNAEDTFARIQRTGVLRVGYYSAAIPFSFFNTQGQLVGYDVAHMYVLAKDLKCKIEFIPFTWQSLLNDMITNKYDIAIGGVWANSDRIAAVTLSNPYIKDPAAFLVPKNKMNLFTSLEKMQSLPKLRLGVYFDPATLAAINQTFPNAELFQIVDERDIDNAFATDKVDAVLRQEISATIYSLGHPNIGVINTPPGIVYPYLVAYMMPRNAEQFRVFINYWLDLQKNNGFSDRMYNRWILGRPIEFDTRRWSILHNVLHFDEK